jgi:hypothetical protein
VPHLGDPGQKLAATDVSAGKADVLETVVGEIPPLMTGPALGLAVEEHKATLGLFRDRLLVAVDPEIEGGALGYDCALIGRDGLGERGRRHAFIRESHVEQRLVLRKRGKTSHHFGLLQIHYGGRLNGRECLVLERGKPPIPREDCPPCEIDDRLRMAAQLRHPVADSDSKAVAPAKARAVAACTGLSRADRKARIKEQLLAQPGLRRHVRIVLGKRDRRRPAIQCLHGIEAGFRLPAEFDLARLTDERRTKTDTREPRDFDTGYSDRYSKQDPSTGGRFSHA